MERIFRKFFPKKDVDIDERINHIERALGLLTSTDIVVNSDTNALSIGEPISSPEDEDESGVLAGDVTGALQNTLVESIQGIGVPNPVSGDDGKAVTYDHSSESYVLSNLTDGVGYSLMQGWRRNTIQNANTSRSEMKGMDDIQTGVTMAFSGTVYGISVNLEGDVGGSGDNYTVELYKDTGSGYVATGLIVTITGGSGTEISAYTTDVTGISFNAGNKLTIYDEKTAGVANVGSKATLFLKLNST